LGGYAVTFVAVTSALCTIIYITLGILGETFLTTLVSAGLMLIIIVVYFIAATKLTAVLGDRNEAGMRIIKLTRQVAAVLVCNAVVQGAYSILGRNNKFTPLLMFISNILMPVFLSAGVLLLLRFIRGSFARQENKITKAAIKRGTRSTASVSPATDFSSATAGGATTVV
jgi:hypothetical protein